MPAAGAAAGPSAVGLWEVCRSHVRAPALDAGGAHQRALQLGDHLRDGGGGVQ